AVVEFLCPLAFEEGADRVASEQKLGTFAPLAVRRAGERHLLGIAQVPGIFCRAHLFRGTFAVEGRQGWTLFTDDGLRCCKAFRADYLGRTSVVWGRG